MRKNLFANPGSEKRLAHAAATAMLQKQDSDSFRYAALELRRCIEAIVYEKLERYGALLPEDSVYQWQPPQAFDALIAVEPWAEETVSYAIANEKEFGKMAEGPYHLMGVDERPKGKWIKKTWNKLGSYLHAEWPFSHTHKPETSARQFLEKTLLSLEPLVRSSFSAMMAQTITFDCDCGKAVKVMMKAVESSRMAVCLTCGMHYRAEKTGEEFSFIPDISPFNCDCGKATYVPPQRVKIGYQFSCRSCNQMFQIVGVEWKFAAITNDSTRPELED